MAQMALRCVLCGKLSKMATTRLKSGTGISVISRNTLVARRAYSSGTASTDNALVRYFRRLKWVPIPLGVGFAYISFQQFGHVREREERKLQTASQPEEIVAKEWQVKVYRALPFNKMSRLWGRFNSLELPVWLREPTYKLYIWAFNCDMEEAAVRDLKHYKNLGELFRRRLRPGCRPVDKNHSLTCPSDGKVLHLGKVMRGRVEQVKGVTYPLQDFLGPKKWPAATRMSSGDRPSDIRLDADYGRQLLSCSDNELYHCVIYLAPGDYHGFHSPTTWDISYRRHFPGDLLSVNPGIASWIQGLFVLNERAVYIGHWDEGFFSMAAIGATNVGSIKVYHDRVLLTNAPGKDGKGRYHDEPFYAKGVGSIPMKKGEPFGEFNLGSTIVLLFEAPKNFQFKVKPGQKVKFGQPLGCPNSESTPRR